VTTLPAPAFERTAPRTEASFEIAGQSDRGLERSSNEDHYVVAELLHGTAIVVADGMGGLERGAVASALAVETIVDHLAQMDIDSEDSARPALESAFSQAHRVVTAGAANGGPMGTTATVAYVSWPRLWVAHVGDSRCYLLRDGNLLQLTEDHTVAQQFLRLGMCKQAQGKEHVLYKALGICCSEATPDVRSMVLEVGDAVLVCSDGLTRHVTEGAIGATLRVDESAAQSCRRLMRAALAGGGTDNVTLVIARMLPPGVGPRSRVSRSGVRPRPDDVTTLPPDE
jgi:PPM family protein phosphatase